MKFIQIISFSLLLLACGSKKNITASAKSELLGQWQWTSSSFISRGMDKPKESSPESRGYTIVLIIDKGNIEIVKNGNSVAKMPYDLIEQENGAPIIMPAAVADDYPFYVSSGPITFNDDELFISGSYNDAGENQTYKRIK